MRSLVAAVLAMIALAILFVVLMREDDRPAPPLLVESSATVYANPQCAVPTLDYSKRPRRLDWKAIA